MKSILSELKVLEIASVLAGPAVGMYFSERGAKVIKLENSRTNGDVTRSWKLASEDKNSPISAYFASVNWNKEYKFVDLGEASHRPDIEQLIKEADILITNFKYGDAKKFKLDFKTVSDLNNRIIHAELSGFGPDNPRVAYDLVLQAETGFMFMNGTPDSEPVKMPLAMIDVLAAHHMKEGILEALLNRERNPKAYHVEASLYDSAVATLTNQATNYLMGDHVPQRIGSRHPNIAPYGEMCLSKDNEYVTFAVGSDSQFLRLLEYLNIPMDDRFQSNKDRVLHRIEIEDLLAEKVKNYEAETLVKDLIKINVPVAQVKNLEQVFEAEAAQNMILEEEMEGMVTKRVKTAAYSLTST